MKLEGKIWKDKETKFWIVHVPLLDISTQGRSIKKALNMIRDAIQIESQKADFKIHAKLGREKGTFTVSATDPDALIAFLLRRQRTSHGLTIRQVSHRLHSNSPTAYAQYEQGKRSPSLGKLHELLYAIDPNLEPVLKAG